MSTPRDAGFWMFIGAYVTGVVYLVGAIVVKAIQFYRKQRADRSRGNVVPFQQER